MSVIIECVHLMFVKVVSLTPPSSLARWRKPCQRSSSWLRWIQSPGCWWLQTSWSPSQRPALSIWTWRSRIQMCRISLESSGRKVDSFYSRIPIVGIYKNFFHFHQLVPCSFMKQLTIILTDIVMGFCVRWACTKVVLTACNECTCTVVFTLLFW